MTSPLPSASVRLLTWNIHKGIGIDRRYSPDRVAAVIRHYAPDVVVLQEVDDGVPRSRSDAQPRLLADLLGFPHVAFGPNVTLKQGRYGNATLSRFPIERQLNLDITFPMKKPRGALVTELGATIDDHHYTVHVLNVHLGLSGVERRWQIRQLLTSQALRHLDRRSRIVLAGDTNDWGGILARGRLAEAGFLCLTGWRRSATRTYPSWSPVGALDKVFVRGPIHCRHVLRSRLRLARHASDHLPIVVDLALGRP